MRRVYLPRTSEQRGLVRVIFVVDLFGGGVHSLKYVVVRHWLRSHAKGVAIVAVIAGIAIYLVVR